MSEINKIVADVERAKMLEKMGWNRRDDMLIKTLTKASEDLVKQISKDENEYEIKMENFNTEIEKELSEYTEKIEKLEAEVEKLQKKADSGDITGDEVEELASKQKELQGLQENYNSEKKSKQKDAKSKLGSISNDLDKAKSIGNATVEKGHELLNSIDNSGKKEKALQKVFRETAVQALKLTGEKAVKSGGELLDKIDKVTKKESDVQEDKVAKTDSEKAVKAVKLSKAVLLSKTAFLSKTKKS